MRNLIFICTIWAFASAGGADLSHKIKAAALRNDVDPALLMALVEQESSFNPNAGRFEPNLYKKWGSREKATSWGLTQVVLGWHGKMCGVTTAKQLLIPDINLNCGAKVLKNCLNSNNTLKEALSCYNGDKSGKYAQGVISKYVKYTYTKTTPSI